VTIRTLDTSRAASLRIVALKVKRFIKESEMKTPVAARIKDQNKLVQFLRVFTAGKQAHLALTA
jgi:hypothetical protein